MATEVKNSNKNNKKIIASGSKINNYHFKLPIGILLSLRKNSLQDNPIHPIDLMTVFNKTKSQISKAYRPFSDDNLIKKIYDYEIGVSKNYLTLKITDSGIAKAEQLLRMGLTDEEWSRITKPSPIEKPSLVKPEPQPIPKTLNPTLPTFRKIKKELLLRKIIDLVKKDAYENLMDNYEFATRDETVTGILDETIDILQSNLYNIFEKFDVVTFKMSQEEL